MPEQNQASQTVTPPAGSGGADSRQVARILEDLQGYARQHAELARKNYETFTQRYGHPLDPVRDAGEKVRARFAEWRSEAQAGWKKLERDIEAKSSDLHSSNGHSPPP
jgi:hypothetical protein